MVFKNFTYLIIVLIAIIVPAIISFRSPVRFYTKLKYFIPSVIFTGTIFIIWNMRFEELGIWNYNPDYITGKLIFRIPVEELLFLFSISYFSFLIYEIVKVKFPDFGNPNFFIGLSLALLVVFGILAYFSREKLYTFFTFFLLSIYFAYTVFRNRFKKHFAKFYLTYLFSVIPFIIIKIVLIYLPALSYNSLHITGFRIISVPVEDFGYFFLLLLMNVTIFEYLNERRYY